MSEPSRLKAIFQAATAGALMVAGSVFVSTELVLKGLAVTGLGEVLGNEMGIASFAIPTLLGIAVGIPLGLFIASRPFRSARSYPATFAATSVVGGWLGAGALSFALS